MNYSISQIPTAADCDVLLQIANKEKEDLAFAKLQNNRQYQTVASGSLSVDAEIAAVTAEIAGLESVIATMPDGETKAEYESRLVKTKHKKFLLEERRERYGILAILQKEYDINCIEKQQVEVENYIAELNQRKEEIG